MSQKRYRESSKYKETRAARYQANKESILAVNDAWHKAHPIERKFHNAVQNARKRGIAFLMTRAEWIGWWGDNMPYRGRHGDSLQMCRFDDEGDYRIGNIYMASASENQAGPRPLPEPGF